MDGYGSASWRADDDVSAETFFTTSSSDLVDDDYDDGDEGEEENQENEEQEKEGGEQNVNEKEGNEAVTGPSLAEAKRFQGLPDSWILCGETLHDKMEMVADAVPPPFAFRLLQTWGQASSWRAEIYVAGPPNAGIPFFPLVI